MKVRAQRKKAVRTIKEVSMDIKGIGPQGLGTSRNNGYTIGEGSKSPLNKTVKDSCYKKVKASYDVFPSAYASGAIAKCRKAKSK